MYRLLLVEDDKTIVTNLTAFLQAEGFAVRSAPGQAGALAALEQESCDLILLDISLSDGNGFAVCSAVKAEYDIPVIFLTASGDEYSTVTGFDYGAEIIFQSRFVPANWYRGLKMSCAVPEKGGGTHSPWRYHGGYGERHGGKNGVDLYLSALEYRLLLVFINNRGAVLSRNKLLEEIWDAAGEFVNDNTLTVYIKRLRDKIEADPQNPQIIKTVRGIGYRVD